jgi:two-component system response regulator AlgR
MADTPLRVIVVDDEAPARRRLVDQLLDCRDALPVAVVGEAINGRDALDLINGAPVDVVFADIRMPVMDGLELARHLLKLSNPPLVVFTTAYNEHALEAFEVQAIDYLVKPVRMQRLLAALAKLPKLRPLTESKLDAIPAQARRFLSVTERSRVLLIPIDEVVYLKAELKYITIRTAEREYLLEESLTRLESEFGDHFLRIHRNCLVSRAHVQGFERRTGPEGETRWEVVLRGLQETLPVSRRQQHVIREIGRDAG